MQHVYSIIVTSCADSALTQSTTTPLKMSHAALLMSLAHQATSIIGVRGLETGFAKDISGVIRMTRGPRAAPTYMGLEQKEYLYFAGGDGGVRVFERGN